MSRVVRAGAGEAVSTVAGREPQRSVTPADGYWVSASAVRQAIGAWAYTLGAAERRPESEAVRAAVAVACAIRELALDPDRRRWRQGNGADRTDGASTAITTDHAAFADCTGMPVRDVERALELLADAHVVVWQRGARADTVVLADAVLVPLPTVAQIAWPAVRARLQAARASVAPALAVLRELAGLAGAFELAELGREAPVVRASVRDLEDATAFGRSTVSDSLAALERAALIDVETRAGRTTRFTLRPTVFGIGDEPVRVEREPSPVPARLPEPASRAPATAPVAGAAGVPTLIGTFAGTPIHAPAGTPLVVSVDAQGRWSCRVGPFLVLGPIAPDEQ